MKELASLELFIDRSFEKYQKYSSKQISLFFGLVWMLEFLICIFFLFGWHQAMIVGIVYPVLSFFTVSQVNSRRAIRIGLYISIYIAFVSLLYIGILRFP
ncbi:MAG TPA: hypothetical protein P5080_06000 [Candidatus Paceibacterota bacterium]|nr:hypothetical protein [Candidatus Pacearchaeota archaeon]HRZ51479.1 hypothetical protein [Candidatus Paceibacterota bacterium]HSA37219.1 hypothetical protein [Candidatus Paceibacterota bacterium]